MQQAGGVDALFRPWDSVNRDFVRACERARIERCSPNDLRRTLALWLRAGGASPDVVGMILGHTTSRMVETVYARLARRPEAVRRLLEAQLEWGAAAILQRKGRIPLHSP
jgi:integrase